MSDSLVRAKQLAREARDLEIEVKDLEERVEEKKASKRKILEETLPDLMNEVGLTKIEVPAEGNNKKFVASLTPFYQASIPAGWGEAERRRAFEALRKHDASDLIKIEVTFTFPKGNDKQAREFIAANERHQPSVKETVHHATLGSWLKERIEEGSPTPDLEVIGGRVGQIVKLK